MTTTYEQEVKEGKRFKFGKNWQNFLSVLDDERITEAEDSLKKMLEIDNLEGQSFLDIGSGSGLFSLAARRLGAKVYSFDYDPNSVSCAQELRGRYFPEDSQWTIEQGSALDVDYLKSLGQFDIVYSWGVLHHTGDMWKALENVGSVVKNQGKLFIAIYNFQGNTKTKLNFLLKKSYTQSNSVGKLLIAGAYIGFRLVSGSLIDLVRLKNPLGRYSQKKKSRGMSVFYDWIDWVGGYPFEVAKPEEIFYFYSNQGFILKKLITCGGGHGCNQFVFSKP